MLPNGTESGGNISVKSGLLDPFQNIAQLRHATKYAFNLQIYIIIIMEIVF